MILDERYVLENTPSTISLSDVGEVYLGKKMYDDSDIWAWRISQVMLSQNQNLSELLSRIPCYHHSSLPRCIGKVRCKGKDGTSNPCGKDGTSNPCDKDATFLILQPWDLTTLDVNCMDKYSDSFADILSAILSVIKKQGDLSSYFIPSLSLDNIFYSNDSITLGARIKALPVTTIREEIRKLAILFHPTDKLTVSQKCMQVLQQNLLVALPELINYFQPANSVTSAITIDSQSYTNSITAQQVNCSISAKSDSPLRWSNLSRINPSRFSQ